MDTSEVSGYNPRTGIKTTPQVQVLLSTSAVIVGTYLPTSNRKKIAGQEEKNSGRIYSMS